MIVNNVKGYLQSRIVYYLMHLHIQPRIIYFARVMKIITVIEFIAHDLTLHSPQIPESLNESSYKADADLSAEGHRQAEVLKNMIINYRQQQLESRNEEKLRPLTVS